MQHLEPRKDDLTNTITSVQKDNYLAEPLSTRGRDVLGTLRASMYKQGSRCMGVVIGDNEKPITETPSIIQKQGDRGTNNFSVNSESAYTIPANPMSDRGQQVVEYEQGFRIRKLTPKECWRLMGFSDDDFKKAKSAGISNSQLYKQAGNSIVVNVLEGILRNLPIDQ